MATYALMQLICAPLWGVLSDRVGRKPVLTLGVLGYAVSLLMFGLATSFWMLFVARSLSGILSSATMPTAMAFIGDSAPEKERSAGMGQLGAAMGIGVVGGPLLGGWLSAGSLSLPFFAGAGLAFISFLLVIFVLPESHRGQAVVERQPPLTRDALRQALLSPAGMLLLLIFIMSFGLTAFQGITGLYVVDKFGFDTRQVGAIWMVMGAMLIVVQGGLTGPLTKKFGEMALIVAGLIGGALGFLGMSLAVDYPTTLLAVGVFTLALALTGPALNATLSALAGERQGAVMGLNSAAGSLGKVIGPLWAGYLYEANIEYPYFSGAGALILALLVCVAGMRAARPHVA
jgi:DHA1 family multidrug resistance protein-like MFS transporter